MFPSNDEAEVLIDWIERDWIRRTLVAARPELERVMVLEVGRPMIRIPSARRGSIIIAKTDDGAMAQWIVGISGQPEPLIHEPGTREEVVRLVLDALDGPSLRGHVRGTKDTWASGSFDA